MKVGILGLGVMGSNHLRVLRDAIGVDEIVVFDSDLQFVNRKIPGAIKCDSYEEFLERQSDLEYSVIATPTSNHSEHLITFLKEGWNVLVEKPIVANLVEYLQIEELAKKSTSRVAVGHIERFNSAIMVGKKKIKDGILGSVFQIKTIRQGPLPIRISDVGVLSDLASHDIDLIHHITENQYSHVFADMKFRSGRKYEDAIMVMGSTNDGTSILHLVNWLSPKKERTITLMGDNGTLVIDCLKSELIFYECASVEIDDESIARFRGVSEGNAVQFAFPKIEALQTQHLQFMRNIRGETSQTVSVPEALKTLVVMDSILSSYQTKQCMKVNYV